MLLSGFMCFIAATSVSFGQTSLPDTSSQPIEADPGFLSNSGAHPKFESATKISHEAELAVLRDRIISVPHFYGAFEAETKQFSYSMVGVTPQTGGTTSIPTQIIPIALFFEGMVDDAGSPIVLDPAQTLTRVQNSPNFRNWSYQTGLTQFGDAVQRAQFYQTMSQDWHTLLGKPELLSPVVIDVPKGSAKVFRNRANGTVYAVVDNSFFISQLNTIIQLEKLDVAALPIALTMNVLLAPEAEVKRCCVLGFHTSFDAGQQDNKQLVQTFVWASWIDQGVLGASMGDVTAISHEISEWMNDPFGTNVVPKWQPVGGGTCQDNLETADPLVGLPNAGFPVLIDGFTFHPHNQVLLPWFERRSQSDAIDGAFSFPDQSLARGPSEPCGTR